MGVSSLIQKPTTRAFDDVGALRSQVYDRVRSSYSSYYPIENTQFKLELDDVDYDQDEPAGLEKQKTAIISGRNMHRSLSGTWRLTDKATNQVVDQRRSRIAMVPHITDRGTIIYRGNEYTVANQMRLKPGVFTRKKENSELESHFNIMPGSGPSFRVFMEPKTGGFYARVGQSKFPLYTLLKGLGVTDAQLVEAWGRDLHASNVLLDNAKHLNKAHEKFTYRRAMLGTGDRQPGDVSSMVDELHEAFDKMRLDPDVMEDTLGSRYDRVDSEVFLKATQKLVRVAKGEVDTDDRDNISYQTVLGPEDLFAERIDKDAGRLARGLLWKATFRRNLDPIINTDKRTRQLQSVLLASGLGMPLEETNPADILDQLTRVTRMGEGGIPGTDSIPEEARAVQPSYLGFIDPIRTSESMKAGVDNRLAYNTYKGDDGQLYAWMIDRRGKRVQVPSGRASRAVVSFPGEVEKSTQEGRRARAMVRGRLKLVDPKEIDFELPSHEDMMSSPAHLVPFLSAIKGHRMLMVSKMFNQALAMQEPEAPWVQTKRINPDDPEDSFEKHFGSKMGSVLADVEGVVKRVGKNEIVVQTPQGVARYELYQNFPFNRKSFMHSTPIVSPGQAIKKGQLLASSNFTNATGTMAVGKNLRVGYLPYKGMTFEDAIVISEGAAKKLTSEHMYQHDLDLDPGQKVSKKSFLARYPTAYPRVIIENFDDRGVIKPGTRVQKGDPLILSITKRPKKGQGVLQRATRDQFTNSTETWKHDSEGIVTDVHVGQRSVNVVVKSYHQMKVGDKMTNRQASKGVVSAIIPDDQMPHDAGGKPLEVLIHPFGIISRTNPSLILEAALGKVAAKTGKPYKISGFSSDDFVDFVKAELQKNGLSDTEDLFDPERQAKIPKVFVGNQFFMKLHHLSEDKLGGRGDDAGYTADMIPGKAKGESSKRIGQQETTSLLSAGATEVLRDAKLIRGQRNDDFWRAFRMGYPAPTPEVPFVYRKFLDDLKGAGINVQKRGNYVHIMALTDKDIDRMSRGPITRAESLDFDTMDPVKGGLFDLSRTGGHGGTGWSHIDLHEPIPNPVMEDPIRRLLGLTVKKFRAVLSGEESIGGMSGGQGVQQELAKINVKTEIERQKSIIKTGPKSRRDDAVKRLRTLVMFEKTGIKPAELMLTKVPVLPPQSRPIVKQSSRTAVAHPNFLYKELMLANDNLRELTEELGSDGVGEERLALYDTFKALAGFSAPIQPKLQEQRVRGILSHALGLKASPKFSAFQRKVLATSTDLVGRAVITPNASLDMDQVGLPEEKAWTLYRPFIIRNLVRGGAPATVAVRLTAERDKRARAALEAEMQRRPVIVNRAPTLHRFGIMAAYPVLVKGSTLQVSPLTTSGFGADFDGDAEQFHVPVSEEAVAEAKDKLLPSRNLTDVRFFDVHYVPGQEYQEGLFRATSEPSEKSVRIFRSRKDVARAYRRGEIGVRDRVKIMS